MLSVLSGQQGVLHIPIQNYVDVSLLPTCPFIIDEIGNRDLVNHSLPFKTSIVSSKTIDYI